MHTKPAPVNSLATPATQRTFSSLFNTKAKVFIETLMNVVTNQSTARITWQTKYSSKVMLTVVFPAPDKPVSQTVQPKKKPPLVSTT